MFGFGRKKKVSGKDARTYHEEGAETFVEATGGGWTDVPDEIAADGGEHADYVGKILQSACEYARENVAIGDEFSYTITNTPRDINSPHEIVFGLMMRAPEYGLCTGYVHDETAMFIRVE